MMIAERHAETLDAVMRISPADETFASIVTTEERFQPFAANVLLAGGLRQQTLLTVTVRAGNRFASQRTNDLRPDALNEMMRRLVEKSSFFAESKNATPFPGLTTVREANLSRESSASFDFDAAVAALATDFQKAQKAGMHLAGTRAHSDSLTSLRSSRGLALAQHTSLSSARIRALSQNGKAAGYAEDWSYDAKEIDATQLADRAMKYATICSDMREVKPGRHRVILSPAVVADLLILFLQQFVEDNVKQKQSFLAKMDGSDHRGTKMFPSNVSLFSDPHHATIPSFPFTSEGAPLAEQFWIKEGVVTEFIRPTESTQGPAVPYPTNIVLDGEKDSHEKLIASTQRAIYINSIANLRIADATNGHISGVTRDGLMMIEEGKLAYGLRNMRFNETPVLVLKSAEAMSRAHRACGRASMFPVLAPSIKVPAFAFLGTTDLI